MEQNHVTPEFLLRPHTRAFLARRHGLLIGDSRQEASNGDRFDILNPATEDVIATAAAAGAVDVDRAVDAARQALETGLWARMTPADRSRRIWALADLIESRADDIAELEVLDNGKSLPNARADVANAASMFRYMAGWPTKLTGETIPTSTPGILAFTTREPVGVVAQIIPWNFPLGMASWKLAPALAAGCTIILKPAEQTPLTALFLGELALEAGIPPGVVNVLTGLGHQAGAALANHPRVDKVAFTGSTEVGKGIVRAAAGNLKRVTLELGGKSPAIVFSDADLDIAISGTANAIFYNQGQNCAAGSRLYVHAKVFDQVVEGVVSQAGRLVIGNGLVAGTDLGPLISEKQLQRVSSYIEQGRRDGAEYLTGRTETCSGPGFFIAPTVLANTNARMSVVREEIFGPVVCVQRFEDEDLNGIIRLANDRRQNRA